MKSLVITGVLLWLQLVQPPAAPAGAAESPVAATAAAPLDRAALADSVRAELLHCWRGYEKYAWGHDELRPVSHTVRDWYAVPVLMTPVDALDALILMDCRPEAARAESLIVNTLSFDSDISVKTFEVTIRLLGGLLSGYQMTGNPRLLALADDLGTRLLPAFNSPTGLPYVNVNLKTGAVEGTKTNPAEIGTLLVEFGTLARLTHKPIYYDKAKNAVVQLYRRRSKIGLVGEEVDVETGAWTSPASHVGGRIDSYYEYLLKCARLFDDRECAAMWRASLKSLNRYLLDDTPQGLWYGQVDMNSGKRTATEFGALHAFLPAVLALGGDLPHARRLQASCYAMWNRHGIEPEVFDYRTDAILYPGYALRPEIMESAYYLRRLTGDPQYLAMGQRFFEALRARCRVDAGYTTLKSVVTGEKGDLMHSFFLTETLKYLYLTFAPDSTLDLDTVTFNTEAHPIRRTW